MTRTPKQQFDNYAEHMARMLGASAPPPRNRPRRPGIWASGGMADAPIQTFETADPIPDPRDEELAALRARVAELEARDRSVFQEAPLLPAPDALMSDWGEVGAGYDDVTGDMLLDAFEQDEAEAVAVIQVLSATRQRHLSEQLNVEKARLRREHMLTDQANPREASIDRLLGLLTRRGD